ncbi:MAG TPA: AraC family transcriptional regulator [Taishania sp.]|nr:AraC family transcriptional regulator [Taishania sp.]
MKRTKRSNNKYYINKVDVVDNSIYCYHDVMGERLIPTHRHDKAQLTYIEGGIVHIVTDKDVYYIPPRHFMWIPAGVDHSIKTNNEEAIMHNIYFPVEEGEDAFFQREGIYLADELALKMLLFSLQWNGDVLPETEGYRFLRAFKYVVSQTCMQALPLSLPYPKNPRLAKVIDFMGSNLEEQLSYSKLSKKYGYSERTLNRLFQKETGMSFIKYLTIQRMLKAIELLVDGKMSVAEIAYAVGYNSVPTFSNTFHKLLGQRPTDYSLSKPNILRSDSEN